MIYTILVMGPPYGTENATSAFLFSMNLIQYSKNTIHDIFFYYDGVYNSSKFFNPLQDKSNLINSWLALNKKFFINLNVCISAASRRGIIDNNIALDMEFSQGNFHECFKLTGLGTLLNCILKSDRLLQF